MTSLSRRSLCGGLLLAACTRRRDDPSASAPPPRPSSVSTDASRYRRSRLEQWSIGAQEGGPGEVAVLIPTGDPPGTRYPVVLALHGRGEALKAPRDGALGWPRDYELQVAIERMYDAPIVARDLHNLTTPQRLDTFNARLRERPYRGLIIACPHVPDLDLSREASRKVVVAQLTETVLPLVRERTPALTGAAHTGIDGVSFGGNLALHVALARPALFGAVGVIQPAIQASDADDLAARWRDATRVNPNLRLRLLTSEGDYFLGATRALSAALRARALPHEYLEPPGPHDYIFNRGPGAYELLGFHDAELGVRPRTDERP